MRPPAHKQRERAVPASTKLLEPRLAGGLALVYAGLRERKPPANGSCGGPGRDTAYRGRRYGW